MLTLSLRRLARGLAAVSAATALTLTAAVSPAAAVPVEEFGSYQPQVSCDPHAKPGVLAFRGLVLGKFGGGDLGIVRACHVGGDSEHKEGRAWDYAVNWYDPADRKRAQATLDWLLEEIDGDPARRLKRIGIQYMIWNNRIWSAYRAEDGWREYTGASAHRDHIHFSFTWNGATKRTSWYTGQVEPYDYGPCPRWADSLAKPWTAPRTEPCPPPLERPVMGTDGTYTAQHQETVPRVARFFGLTGEQVRRWNDWPSSGRVRLYPGMAVRVVPDANRFGRYRVRAGETVQVIAGYFGVTGRQIRRWNELPLRGDAGLRRGQRVRVVAPAPAPETEPGPVAPGPGVS